MQLPPVHVYQAFDISAPGNSKSPHWMAAIAELHLIRARLVHTPPFRLRSPRNPAAHPRAWVLIPARSPGHSKPPGIDESTYEYDRGGNTLPGLLVVTEPTDHTLPGRVYMCVKPGRPTPFPGIHLSEEEQAEPPY